MLLFLYFLAELLIPRLSPFTHAASPRKRRVNGLGIEGMGYPRYTGSG